MVLLLLRVHPVFQTLEVHVLGGARAETGVDQGVVVGAGVVQAVPAEALGLGDGLFGVVLVVVGLEGVGVLLEPLDVDLFNFENHSSEFEGLSFLDGVALNNKITSLNLKKRMGIQQGSEFCILLLLKIFISLFENLTFKRVLNSFLSMRGCWKLTIPVDLSWYILANWANYCFV